MNSSPLALGNFSLPPLNFSQPPQPSSSSAIFPAARLFHASQGREPFFPTATSREIGQQPWHPPLLHQRRLCFSRPPLHSDPSPGSIVCKTFSLGLSSSRWPAVAHGRPPFPFSMVPCGRPLLPHGGRTPLPSSPLLVLPHAAAAGSSSSLCCSRHAANRELSSTSPHGAPLPQHAEAPPVVPCALYFFHGKQQEQCRSGPCSSLFPTKQQPQRATVIHGEQPPFPPTRRSSSPLPSAPNSLSRQRISPPIRSPLPSSRVIALVLAAQPRSRRRRPPMRHPAPLAAITFICVLSKNVEPLCVSNRS
jgi:hypothetical protein